MRRPLVGSRLGGNETLETPRFSPRTRLVPAPRLAVQFSTTGYRRPFDRSPRSSPDADESPLSNELRSARTPRRRALQRRMRGSQRRQESLRALRALCHRRKGDRMRWRLCRKRAMELRPRLPHTREPLSGEMPEIRPLIPRDAQSFSRSGGSEPAPRRLGRLRKATSLCLPRSRSRTATHPRGTRSSNLGCRRVSLQQPKRARSACQSSFPQHQAAAGGRQIHSILAERAALRARSSAVDCRARFVQRRRRPSEEKRPPLPCPRGRFCVQCATTLERGPYAQTPPQSA